LVLRRAWNWRSVSSSLRRRHRPLLRWTLVATCELILQSRNAHDNFVDELLDFRE
jgi:hypothetical protein